MSTNGPSGRRDDRAVVAWSTALTVLVLAPWFVPGYVLSYDMVWVPDWDLTRAEVWGMGTALPRAVPSDAVIGLLDLVLPSAVIQRVVVGATLIVAGVGAARLVGDLPLVPRLAAASFMIWNPFVAERLVIGHWPLLAAYAAVPWLLDAARRDTIPWARVTVALAACALSPAGGVIGAVAAVVVLWRRGALRAVLIAVAVNAPWIVAGLLAADARSDPSAITAFAAQGEGPFGHVGTLLALGGIWNSDVVLPSRTFATTAVIVAVMWLVMIAGVRGARSHATALLALLAGIGLVVSSLGWVAPGVLEVVVADVPGAGLLRDGTRFLALVAPLFATLFAHGVAWVLDRFDLPIRRLVCAMAVLLPLAALPDLAVGAGGRLEPVDYPASWAAMRSEIQRSEVGGDLLVLPFTAYRAPVWNENRPVLDPAGRYFNRPTVVADDLIVSGDVIAGEDPRADAVRDALEDRDVAQLTTVGIGLAVEDTSAPADSLTTAFLADLAPIAERGPLRLYAFADARARERDAADVAAIVVAWSTAFLTVGWAAVAAAVRRFRRGSGGTPDAAGDAART